MSKNPTGMRFGNVTVPLSQIPQTQSFHNKILQNAHNKLNRMGISPNKPGHRLPGTWFDQYVVARIGVNMCPNCATKYGGNIVHPKYGYRCDPNPQGAKFGVCDACGVGKGTAPSTLIPYYAQENFEKDRIKSQPTAKYKF